ncbi:pilus assembly protein PilM [Algisphaera agarilytica]|uniref:Type IV pilus assembly protein PilM n=1 Tax=Algisphaera agarilytica TaxID=1385975 RepID=A0A7X0H4Q9_9BACT|nr:pilus assembly protein PilM [Algisphaera agarilytica]MBB6429252.1 type IV pilus assembly protein PilM [Algisphaera agarilytica]
MIGRTPTTPIGLDLGDTVLRAVQLEQRNCRWEARDAIEMSRLYPGQPFNEDEARRLAAVLSRRSFVGQSLVVSLPNGELIRGLVEVNGKTEDGPMFEAALEIERTHALEPGTYELAAWLPPASGNRRQTAVCVNGCKHATSTALLDAFESAGLTVLALDSRACAIGRVLEPPRQGQPQLTAVLDIEAENTELTLIHDGNVVYQRALLDSGLNQAAKRLADHGLSETSARYSLSTFGLAHVEHDYAEPVRKALAGFVRGLVQEAEPALDYAARIYTDLPIERLAVVGCGAAVPALGYELQQQLRLATPAKPIEVASLDQAAAFAVALGMALHPEEVAWAAA